MFYHNYLINCNCVAKCAQYCAQYKVLIAENTANFKNYHENNISTPGTVQESGNYLNI